MTRLQAFSINLGLVIVSVGLTYLLFELALFPALVRDFPLRLHIFLNEPSRIFAQSSKTGSVPAPGFIALIGDSNAQGLGHWLIASDPNTNGAFHSAHVIHDLTGTDVISLGKGGSSSAEAMIHRTSDLFGFFYHGWRMQFPQPGRFVVYFSESNDLSDNELFLATKVDRAAGADCWRSDVCLDRELRRHNEVVQPAWRHFARQLYFGRFIIGIIVEYWKRQFRAGAIPFSFDGRLPVDPPPGETTKALVGGAIVALPDGLAGPALSFTELEIERGLRVLARSLAYVRTSYPHIPISVVYVPAPLTCYEIASEKVESDAPKGRRNQYSRDDVVRHSDRIAEAVARLSTEANAAFLDTRPAIRARAKQVLVHGPHDPGHLNEAGYRALGAAVAQHLKSIAGSGS